MARTSLIITGVIVLILGIAIGSITLTQSHLWGAYQTSSTPYTAVTLPMVIGGIILIIVGIAIPGKKKHPLAHETTTHSSHNVRVEKTPTEMIKELNKMREDKIISDKEFEKKKKQLLKRIK